MPGDAGACPEDVEVVVAAVVSRAGRMSGLAAVGVAVGVVWGLFVR